MEKISKSAEGNSLSDKSLYIKNIIKEILEEMKKTKTGEITKKILCLNGEPSIINNVHQRLKSGAGRNKITFTTLDSAPYISSNDSQNRIFIYRTSELNPGDDEWVSRNHPGLVIIIEDTRSFTGQCDKRFSLS